MYSMSVVVCLFVCLFLVLGVVCGSNGNVVLYCCLFVCLFVYCVAIGSFTFINAEKVAKNWQFLSSNIDILSLEFILICILY